jgi:hypothetical protein
LEPGSSPIQKIEDAAQQASIGAGANPDAPAILKLDLDAAIGRGLGIPGWRRTRLRAACLACSIAVRRRR